MPDPCRSCEFREVDFGGCRCQAALITGDATVTDPACQFSPDRTTLTEFVEASQKTTGGFSMAEEEFVFRQNAGSGAVQKRDRS
jgi:pyrroloquinoline quinone biosynthesis protein E